MKDYFSFIVLLGALFVISGGIFIKGEMAGTPLVNTVFLAIGAILANLIGTTGASMLLIRPYLRANHARQHQAHLVIFFIFIVSNVGGALTPLGDPPLVSRLSSRRSISMDADAVSRSGRRRLPPFWSYSISMTSTYSSRTISPFTARLQKRFSLDGESISKAD